MWITLHTPFYIEEEFLGPNGTSKICWFEGKNEIKIINNDKVPVSMALLKLSMECYWQHQQQQYWKHLWGICITANYTEVSSVWINLTAWSLPSKVHSYMYVTLYEELQRHNDCHQQEKYTSWQLPGQIISFHHWLEFFWINYCSMMATVYSQNNCGFKPQGNWHNLCSMSEIRKIQKAVWILLNLLTAQKLLHYLQTWTIYYYVTFCACAL